MLNLGGDSSHLDLSGNYIAPDGAESLARVLGQCPALAHLNLRSNRIGKGRTGPTDDGANSLAGVLGQCTALAHLDLSDNELGVVGRGKVRASWGGQASGLLL